jgi:hypothetical protein
MQAMIIPDTTSASDQPLDSTVGTVRILFVLEEKRPFTRVVPNGSLLVDGADRRPKRNLLRNRRPEES